ncbi:flagellar hook-associated protein FlgK [Mangrovicoccus ximenensis]|uniref:flagellar hook-associated protein FlgK n=1 Tax=Mangrovicoccus ximenensis TaxID=1911570 RepID=UPI000D36A123|nr:flagellar hook-associated protein FlgK [Mangrovicoccus ximenensis]
MSISGALSNALSGLTASSRLAEVAASNIANVMTEGYGVREAVLAPRAGGDTGGVRVVGVTRLVDQVLVADRRSAESGLAHASTAEMFFSRMQRQLGLPMEAGSLTDRISKLEVALAQATSAPESEPHLLTVTDRLSGIVQHLNGLGESVQTERLRADRDIAAQVAQVNAALKQLQAVNASIQRNLVLNHDVSAMLDQRQALVDQVGKIIPVTELPRSNGSIALMSPGGQLLLDGKAAILEFSPAAVMTPNMTFPGALSPLKINGEEVETEGADSPIAGGAMQGLFKIRDHSAVDFQAKLDGFARDLVERLDDPSVDLTLSTADPGLLSDGGTRFDAANEVGLAQRLQLNVLVDQGGEVWRVRDGLGAVAPGPEGKGALLLRLSDALSKYSMPSSTTFGVANRNSAGLAADVTSFIGQSIEVSEGELAFSSGKLHALKQLELAQGVDSDAEMQRLLIIEQSYAANARVVQVVDEMLEWLMRI